MQPPRPCSAVVGDISGDIHAPFRSDEDESQELSLTTKGKTNKEVEEKEGDEPKIEEVD